MSNPEKDRAKALKKAAKARVKAEKAKDRSLDAPPPQPGGSSMSHSSRPSPADRAAEAAERQVRLQRFRVIFALITAVAALLSVLIGLGVL